MPSEKIRREVAVLKKGIISISREFGSGGHTIAKRTAEELGIPCYDTEIIQEMAKETGLTDELIQQAQKEKVNGSFLYNLVMGTTNPSTIYEKIYQAQKKVILSKAAEGPCIIVGLATNIILTDNFPKSIPVLRVFVYADMQHRISRAVNQYHLSEAQARNKIQESDRARTAQSRNLFDKTWGDRNNYDLMLNTSILGTEECSSMLVKIYSETPDIL